MEGAVPADRHAAHGLSDTSALVMLWAQGAVHTSRGARAYLKLLDLDAGRGLLARCGRVWPHYDQVIKNRKRRILDIALQRTGRGGFGQVVILAAGMDALSVELVSRRRGLAVYEADAAHMGLKADLIRRSGGDPDGRIRFLEADLRSPAGIPDALGRSGWDGSAPSVLVLEGISYYLGRDGLSGILGLFATGRRRNAVILEYLLAGDAVAGGRRHIPDAVFGAIGGEHGTEITRYARDEIRGIMEGVGGRVVADCGMREMERDRLGRNLHFMADGDGWINVCHAEI